MKVLIDSQEIVVEQKMTILETARLHGIYIPSLCDYPRLAPFSGCRLCLVEVKGRRGYAPACSTYVEDGLEVLTQTAEIQKLRRQILELILSEHPNACLICSEKEKCEDYKSTIRKVGETTGCVLCANNGRCPLQDVVEALKIDKVSFPSLYRNLEIRKDDPFFDRNYNLCILCGRCVRICHEVRGASALAFIFRGPKAEVGTAFDRTLVESGCQFCGACVDVCPTGALIERAVRYEGLPDKKVETVCALCSLGCELTLELKGGKIISSLPAEGGAVNLGQACVKGRFAVRDLVHHPRRLIKPMIRQEHGLEETSWDKALSFVAGKLAQYKANEIALVGSAQAACEDIFVFNKFAREGLKTQNLSASINFSPLAQFWQTARENGIEPCLNFKISDMAKAKTLVLIEEDIAASHPLIWLEMLKAIHHGAKLVILSQKELSVSRFSSHWFRILPGSEVLFIGCLSRILLEGEETSEASDISRIEGYEDFKKNLQGIKLTQILEVCGAREGELRKFTRLLQYIKPVVFLFGAGFTRVPWAKKSLSALWNLALLTQAQLIPLGLEGNERGMFEILLHSQDKAQNKEHNLVQNNAPDFNHIIQSVQDGIFKALYLAGPFPGIEKAKPEFVVVQDSFANENMKFADAVFPAAVFPETEGTMINIEGRIQKVDKACEPPGEAKPDWWIVSELAHKMGFSRFRYRSAAEVMEEMQKNILGLSSASCQSLKKSKDIFIQAEEKEQKKFISFEYSPWPAKSSPEYPFLLLAEHSTDSYRSLILGQEIKGLRLLRNPRWIKVSLEDAQELGLRDGDEVLVESAEGEIEGVVKITGALPRGIGEATAFPGLSPEFLMSGIIPVKITRGKNG